MESNTTNPEQTDDAAIPRPQKRRRSLSSCNSGHPSSSSSEPHTASTTASTPADASTSASASSSSRPPRPPPPPPRRVSSETAATTKEKTSPVELHAHANGTRNSSSPAEAQTPTQRRPSSPKKPIVVSPLELSIVGHNVPADPIVRAVSDFLYRNIQHENVEIEAKLGILIDRRNLSRIYLPISTETVINPGDSSWVKFESNMTLDQHAFYNRFLNEQVEARRKNPNVPQIVYRHTKEVDQHYDSPAGKIRVTRDMKTGEVVPGKIVQKSRVADLNVFSPSTAFDFRISVNTENPRELPAGQSGFERQKDRISYAHQIMQIDLTQVTQQNRRGPPASAGGPGPEITHELELEFSHPLRDLVAERAKVDRGAPNHFLPMVQAFVNNCRVLAKIAKG